MSANLHLHSAEGSFHEFGAALLQQEEVSWDIRVAHARVVLTPLHGMSFTVSHLAFQKGVSMRGCGGLNATELRVFDLIDSPSGVHFHAAVSVNNPSAFDIMDIGVVTFNALYDNKSIGIIRSDKVMSLVSGENLLVASGPFAPVDSDSTSQMISYYLNGQPVKITARAPMVNASDVPIFNPFIGGLTMGIELQGLAYGIIHAARVDFNLDTIAEVLAGAKVVKAQTSTQLINPFDIHLGLLAMHLEVLYKGHVVGRVDATPDMVLKPKSMEFQKPVDFVFYFKEHGAKAEKFAKELLETVVFHPPVNMTLRGNFTMQMGGNTFHPKYFQQNVLSCTFLAPGKC